MTRMKRHAERDIFLGQCQAFFKIVTVVNEVPCFHLMNSWKVCRKIESNLRLCMHQLMERINALLVASTQNECYI